MKRIFKLVLITALTGSLLMISSCSEDFLVKEPPGTLAGSVMASPEGVEGILIGAYSTLQGRSRFAGAMATDWTYGGAASDDCCKGYSPGDVIDYRAVERYECYPSFPYMRERWRDCYDGVSRTNQVLVFLWAAQEGARPLTVSRALEVEAEAKFLRAWFHFKANRIFEKIPYIKTETELGDLKPEEVPNEDEGWDEIEADLQFAIDNLPTTHPLGEVGRATKYAAMAVKAHAHMMQGEFSQAKILLDAIISGGEFSLVSNYYDNYDMTHENNEESIFEIQAATSESNHSSILIAGPSMHQSGPAGLGWGFYQPSQNLFEAFQVDADGLPVLNVANRDPLENDMGIASSATFVPTNHLLDPRVDWTISRRGINYLGWGISEGKSWIREQSYCGPYMTKKYMHLYSEKSLNSYGRGFDNGKNYRAYRLAHILLWRAEIAVEDNELDKARLLVNQVRDRAKGSNVVMGHVTTYKFDGSPITIDWNQPAANYKVEPYPPGHQAFSSQVEARKAVRMEIRLEFATEGHRFFDLRRWGIADEVLNAYIAQDVKFMPYMNGAVYNPTQDDYWPLPQDQIDFQKGILKQDSSYLNHP